MSRALDEETLEDLDQSGFPEELVADWISGEAKCLKAALKVAQSPAQLPAVHRRYAKKGRLLSVLLAPFLVPGHGELALRQDAIRLMRSICGPRQEVWFRAVAVLDMHRQLFPGSLKAECLPELCMSVVYLLDKLDGDTKLMRSVRWHHPTHVRERVLRLERMLFLQSSQLLCQPSLLDWLSALRARTRALAVRSIPQMCLASKIDQAFSDAAAAALTALWHGGLRLASPPSHAAIGLFSCSLARGCLLPLEFLQPPDLDFLQWSMLFCEGFGVSEVPQCLLDSDTLLSLIEVLEVSTACTSAALRRHAGISARTCRQAQASGNQF
mmetsp:Transcript_81961/g.240612  ORF Transcript_81961/g.240612 Transcript_81961/m.240612 type:complete len:326 (+) Transcript_81961:67-1044(+)